ncbi:MAG: hypothetical protein L3J34_02190 [Flavobacteriaceae bacterium]|nr:hypothetical protein [Flavobacteriaceae bacterium]
MKLRKTVILIFVLIQSIYMFGQSVVYPSIENKSLIIEGDKCSWDADNVHTLSIVEANKDGYKYWGYYGLDHYNEKDPLIRKGGLVRSNDLENWEKYENNPIINKNCRWPTAVYANETFYIFYAEYDNKINSQIVMESSKDGINFENRTVIVPYVDGEQNQNPFIYLDKNDANFYLFYYNGTERAKKDNKWNIMVKKAANINQLKDSKPYEVISANETIAAPSIAFYNGKYYLLVEEFEDFSTKASWETNAFYSDKVDRGFKRVANNPILSDNDACAFQYIFDNRLYVTYSHAKKTGEVWNLKMIKLK